MTKKNKKEFEDIKDKLYVIEQNGEIYKLDFDNNEGVLRAEEKPDKELQSDTEPSQPPTKKNEKIMTNEKELSEDITRQQVRENYWHETKETKLDGSTAMMETRIAKCIEAGGTFEECSKKVKAEMKKKGSENTNTEDMDEEEEVEEEEEETEEKTDMVEQLKAEKEKLEKEKAKLETDMKSMKDQFAEWGDTMSKIKEERAIELAQKRNEKIKKISKDFQLAEEELKEEALKEILEKPTHDMILDFVESILDKAGKRAVDTETLPETEDFTDYLNSAQQEHEKLMAKYDLRRTN